MKKFLPRLMLVAFITYALAGAAALARAGFDSAPISESSYWELVARSRADANKLKDAPAEDVNARFAQLAEEWKSVTEVRMDNGQVVAVNNLYLLKRLQTFRPDTREIVEILDALLAAHAEHPRAVFSAADLDPLRGILARPEYQWKDPQPNPIGEWFQDAWDRFFRWLDSIFGDLGIPVPNFPIFPLIASVLLAAILFFAFRTLLVDFALEARIKLDDEAESEPLTSDAAFDKAQTLSRGGDYRSAVRYLYLSSLLLLDERDIMRYDRSKTNREVLRSVANSPELSQPLGEVIEVFDDTWYGYHDLDEETFQHYSKRVEELKGKRQ